MSKEMRQNLQGNKRHKNSQGYSWLCKVSLGKEVFEVLLKKNNITEGAPDKTGR